MPKTTVKVVPNPYHAIDHEGTPQCVVGLPGARAYIGATLDLIASAKTGKSKFFYPDFPSRTYEVPLSADISTAVRDGSLLAADLKSAKLCGLSEKEFKAVDAILADEKARTAKSHKACFEGRDDAPTIADVPTEQSKPEPGEPETSAKPRVVLSGTPDKTHLELAPNDGAGKA